MRFYRYRFSMGCSLALFLSFSGGMSGLAQVPVPAGAGTYASAPPFYKAKTSPSGPGFNATAMLSREIFADELPSTIVAGVEAPGRPIPTNDWWTDIINNRFSGALWSYPAMLKTSSDGVEIYWPSYWADAGKEMKSRSHLTVGGGRFRAASAIAADWHDWDVEFRMEAASGSQGEMLVTAVHGTPFTWFEYRETSPEVTVGEEATLFGEESGRVGIRIGSDLYAIYFDPRADWRINGGKLSFGAEARWLSVALLRSETDLTVFEPYAASVPRDTRVEWDYDEMSARIHTRWSVDAENLRDSEAAAPVLQGFLPHTYKYATPGAVFNFIDEQGFTTPRGVMKLGASTGGSFSYSYQFSGMLPTYGAPMAGNAAVHGFRPEVLDKLMADYAANGSFGGDTYWGGKGLVQMAMNMSFARQTGNEAAYAQSKGRLREALEDWLTYTPGEEHTFFSYYPRWGAMLGFDVSYDSDAFNDHHFHYGYFTYAAALLCMEDADFAEKYGELLTLIAKDYANWDRNDVRFPFMRTLDPWCGHSWAGGLGDHGNDNGNGQESSSEAMQSWGGLYLLGVALGDKEMRDAGLWGWNTEARAVREYWYDVDAPRPANAGGRKEWEGKGSRRGNYDYDEYPYAYNSNITGKGIGWWTWFGGDPLFMHGIQWMPISPALDYLSWDADFAGWAYDDMMSGANSTFTHSWFETTYNTDNGEAIEPLASNDWGAVTLTYLQRSNPGEAARILDEALDRGLHIATSVGTSHISYYVTHSHLTYGDPDFSVHADIPTAQVRVKDGVATYLVYNPDRQDRTVRFYSPAGILLKSVNAPAGRLAAIAADPKATSIEASLADGAIIPPAGSSTVIARVLDQYGAGMPDAALSLSLSAGAPATLSGHTLRVRDDARRGSSFDLILTDGELTLTLPVTVNDPPAAMSATLSGVPEVCEKNVSFGPEFTVTDQYGSLSVPADTEWIQTDSEGAETPVRLPVSIPTAGRYTLTARSATAGKECSAAVYVTPPMPVISVGCDAVASSAENGGTMPGGAVDGDNGVRWGSAHTEDEWLVVDLGEDCLVSRVDILWEAAYASRYELQLAPDGCEQETIDVDYAGVPQRVTVPAETAWTTTFTEHATGAGHRVSTLNATGRYIRMKGVERGSAYGYSLYEMTVSGLRGSLADDAVIGIDFTLPEVMDSGESVTLRPKAYTRGGDVREDVDVSWSSDKEAGFENNDFTPAGSGLYAVTATLKGCGSSTGTTFVNDVERAVSVSLEKSHLTAIENVPLEIPFSVMNQFMAPWTGDITSLKVSVTDAAGNPTDVATYDAATRCFLAVKRGEYVVDFSGLGSCRVEALPVEEVNLALGKTAWDSSHENDSLTAAFAVDGRRDTRWGSRFMDEQWMTVDLENVYELDRVLVYWNNPAYATDYSVEVSTTGYDDDFITVDHVTDYRYSADPRMSPCNGAEARYVRIRGHRRSTGYGTSIDELEVYGRSMLSVSVDEMPEEQASQERWFTIDGLPISAPSEPGFYIRRKGFRADRILRR